MYKSFSLRRMKRLLTSRTWLAEKFSGRWIGRTCAKDINITWSPRSPDQTPDNFLLGFIKGFVYKQNHENLNLFKADIVTAFQ